MTEHYLHPYQVNVVDTLKRWRDAKEDFNNSDAYRLQLEDQHELVKEEGLKYKANAELQFEVPMKPECSIEFCIALGRQLLVAQHKNVERILEWQLKRTPTAERLQLIRWIDSHTNAFMNAHAVSPEHRANLRATEAWLNTHIDQLLANHPDPVRTLSSEGEKYNLISLLEKKNLHSFPEPHKIEKALQTAFKSGRKMTISSSHYKQLILLFTGKIPPHKLTPMTTTLTKNELLILSRAIWKDCYNPSNADRSAKLNASEIAAIFKLLFPDTINSIQFSNLAKMAKRRYTEAEDHMGNHQLGKSSRISDKLITLFEQKSDTKTTTKKAEE